MSRIRLLSSVALIEDLPNQNLTRGQIGTVVEYLERQGEEALLVEFADDQGRTYAMVDLKPEQVIGTPSQDRGCVTFAPVDTKY